MQGKFRISVAELSVTRTPLIRVRIPPSSFLLHPSPACALCLFLLLFAACRQGPVVVVHTAAGAAVRVPVELALTRVQQSRGLMYRKDLPEDAGMLFVFPETEVRTFWMKNTVLPLDMIFIGEDLRIVGIVEDAVPFTETSRSVGKPSRYVLEVHAGFCKRHGIAAGDRVELPALPTP